MKSDLSAQELLLRRTLPVVINSFNQFTYLKNLIEKLERDSFRNFIIIDNNSKYPPILSYYLKLENDGRAAIIYYGENKGPHFFHMKGIYRLFGSLPHIFTDPDLSYEALSENFVTELMITSEKYSMFKVGPALEIPGDEELDHSVYCEKEGVRYSVKDWEKQFWSAQVETGLYYPGQIDTTFHLFNPKYFKVGSCLIDGIRIAKPGFIFKHLPWYKDKGRLPNEESIFYKAHATAKNTWRA